MRWAWLATSMLGCAAGASGTPISPPPDGAVTRTTTIPFVVVDGGASNALPALSCPSGAIDLGAMSARSGSTHIRLGPLVARSSATSAVFGTIGVTDPFALCVPGDTVSFAVGTVGPAVMVSFVSPVEGELIRQEGTIEQHRQSPAQPGRFGFYGEGLVHPVSAERRMAPGTYVFRFGVGEGAEGRVSIRRGAATSGRLWLNVVFCNAALTTNDYEGVTAAFEGMREIYARIGVEIAIASASRLDDAAFAVVDAQDLSLMQRIAAAQPIASPETPLRTDALTVYFVREVLDDGEPLGGFSPVPGDPSALRDGVFIGTAGNSDASGRIDSEYLATTLAHEAGHFLGLQHTTSSSGREHDVITDTPECPVTRDRDDDRVVSDDECADLDGSNLMFWGGLSDQITPHQAAVLRASPVVQPL